MKTLCDLIKSENVEILNPSETQLVKGGHRGHGGCPPPWEDDED